MRSSSGISNPLLALLLVLISVISTCVSAPTKSSATILRSDIISIAESGTEHGLAKRTLTYQEIFQQLNNAANTRVNEGEVYWGSPEKGDKYIRSTGFDGCVGIVIASDKRAIVAHYYPQNGPKKGEAEPNLEVPGLQERINEHRDDLQDGRAFVFGSTVNDIYEYQWQVEKVTTFIEREFKKEGEEGKGKYPVQQTEYKSTADYALREWDYDAMNGEREGTLGSLLVEFPSEGNTVVYFEGVAPKQIAG